MPPDTRHPILTGPLGLSLLPGAAHSQQPVPDPCKRHPDPVSVGIRKPLAKLLDILLLIVLGSVSASAKERLFVLTDIGGDPDDQMSMVRLMTYANHMDIEGLVATPAGSRSNVAPEHIQRIVGAYGKVRDNLELHEPGYPTEEYLCDRITKGIPFAGMQGVGGGKDSPGSELLIRAVDRDDARPLWVSVWGGPNVLAQALWKVRATRSPDALAAFVAKLRVYAISDQDNSGRGFARSSRTSSTP